MKTRLYLSIALPFFLLSTLIAQKPRVFLMNADTLVSIQSAVFKGDKRYVPAVKRLIRDADKALKLDIVTITEKEIMPPSGDIHDYFSLSRYWWPDPEKPDGLPYIRRDGETNPESEKIPDHKNLNSFIKSVTTLALGYYYSGNEEYAARASEWLTAWFIKSETRMNPNLRFAQQVRGRDVERGTGILDGREFSQLVDAIGILRLSRSLPRDDDRNITSWFKEYLTWLVESPNGKSESNARNNHGSWYDVHATSVALFVGDKTRANAICEEAKTKRIGYQITPEGRQPEELARTLSWHYSQFNLTALFRLATLSRHVGIDLFNYSSTDGRSIRTGLDYLIPFAYREKEWEEKQIKAFDNDMLALVARQAAAVYGEKKYQKVWERFFDGDGMTNRSLLQFGLVSFQN